MPPTTLNSEEPILVDNRTYPTDWHKRRGRGPRVGIPGLSLMTAGHRDGGARA